MYKYSLIKRTKLREIIIIIKYHVCMEILNEYRLFEFFNLKIRVNIVLRLCEYTFVHWYNFMILVFVNLTLPLRFKIIIFT